MMIGRLCVRLQEDVLGSTNGRINQVSSQGKDPRGCRQDGKKTYSMASPLIELGYDGHTRRSYYDRRTWSCFSNSSELVPLTIRIKRE
jgi:hypothetical protein